MTGCSSFTSGEGENKDNDEKMVENGYEGDKKGKNQIYARCCRIG
tara:strand:+ start:2445 stop:2579 length:135 start_codon:yes stop_codon:yes gene_type:complete